MALGDGRQVEARTVVVTPLLTHLAAASALTGVAVLTRSGAILAAAVAAAAVAGVQLLVVAGHHRSRQARRMLPPRPPSTHRRERAYWSLATAVLLLGGGAALLATLGAERLATPSGRPVHHPEAAVAVAVAGLVLQARPLALAATTAHRDRGDARWWSYLRHARQPEWPALLTQEALSTLVMAAAAVAVATAAVTGEPAADTPGMLAVAGVMAAGAAAHLVHLRELVPDRPASGSDQQGITAAVEVEPCVTRLAQLETQLLGPGELLVGGRVTLVDGLDGAEVADALRRLEVSIRRAVPAVRAVYLQPELRVTTLPRDLDPPPPATPPPAPRSVPPSPPSPGSPTPVTSGDAPTGQIPTS